MRTVAFLAAMLLAVGFAVVASSCDLHDTVVIGFVAMMTSNALVHCVPQMDKR